MDCQHGNNAAINVLPSARYTRISGNYFGFDQSGAQIPSPCTNWVAIGGDNVVIGVRYEIPFNSALIVQRNVFAPPTASGSMIHVTGNITTISGNLFGYDSNGNASTLTVPAGGCNAINNQADSVMLVGTNVDTFGDYLEANWFGCVTASAVYEYTSSQSEVIKGNYFGFVVVDQFPAVRLLPHCSGPVPVLSLQGATTVGKPYPLSYH